MLKTRRGRFNKEKGTKKPTQAKRRKLWLKLLWVFIYAEYITESLNALGWKGLLEFI